MKSQNKGCIRVSQPPALWPLPSLRAALCRFAASGQVRSFTLVAAGSLLTLVLFLVAAWVRLLFAPVSLGPFAGAVSGALADALPSGLAMTYEQVAVEWSREDSRVSIAVIGTRLLEGGGRAIIAAPKADIDLAVGPLLQGRIAVRRITLVGVELTLVRSRGGQLRLGSDAALLDRLREKLSRPGSTPGLNSLAVRQARLNFIDEGMGLKFRASGTNITLTRLKKKNKGEIFDVLVGGDVAVDGHSVPLKAQVDGGVQFPVDTHGAPTPVTGVVHLRGLQPFAPPVHSSSAGDQRTVLKTVIKAAQKVASKATGHRFGGQDDPLTAEMTVHFSGLGGHPVAADFQIAAQGAFSLPRVAGPVHIRRFVARGHYDGARKQLILPEARIEGDKINAFLHGALQTSFTEDGTLERVGYGLKAEKVALDLPGIYGAPIGFSTIQLEGDWLRAEHALRVTKLATAGSPFLLQMSGKVTFVSGKAPGLEASGTLAAMSVRDLVRYWPLVAAHGGREWVDRSMPSGRVGPFTVVARMAPGALDAPRLEPDALDLRFAINDAEASYIKGLTPITHAYGTGTLTGSDFTIDVHNLKVGSLTVSKGSFYISDIHAAQQTGMVRVHLAGGISDILKLIDMKPLGYPTRFGISPSAASGSAETDLSLDIPLVHNVSVNAVKIGVSAKTSGFGLNLGPRLHLTDGGITFDVDNTHLHAYGATGLGGSSSRLNVDWTEDFNGARAVTTRITLKGVMDSVARKSFDLGTEEYLRGPIGISGSFTGRKGALKQGNLLVDMTGATVVADPVGISKPAGFPSVARVVLNFGAHSLPSSVITRVSGPGTNVSAVAQFTQDGALSSLQIPVFRFGQKTDFSVSYSHSAGAIDLSLSGRLFDASRLMRARGSSSGASGAAQAHAGEHTQHYAVKLDHVFLRDGVQANNMDLSVAMTGGRLAGLRLSGTLGKGALHGGLSQNEAGRTLSVDIGDAGAVLKGVYGISGIRGGRLEGSAFFPGRASDPVSHDPNAPDFKGKLTLKDAVAVDQPFLARLFSAGSLGGLINLMQGDGIGIDSVEMPFTSHNEVISVHELQAVGPAIGLTAEGYIDRRHNALALKGTLVPLYGLNSVLGNIPLLGSVLTSKKGEGIIGMSYSVKGNLDEPTISVNPLSVLAPGILRRIVEGKIPDAMQAPSNNPGAKDEN